MSDSVDPPPGIGDGSAIVEHLQHCPGSLGCPAASRAHVEVELINRVGSARLALVAGSIARRARARGEQLVRGCRTVAGVAAKAHGPRAANANGPCYDGA